MLVTPSLHSLVASRPQGLADKQILAGEISSITENIFSCRVCFPALGNCPLSPEQILGHSDPFSCCLQDTLLHPAASD